MKLKLDQENRKKKNLMNVAKKAQTEKPKTSLEKQIEMNRRQTSLKKMKSKFLSNLLFNYLQRYEPTEELPNYKNQLCTELKW